MLERSWWSRGIHSQHDLETWNSFWEAIPGFQILSTFKPLRHPFSRYRSWQTLQTSDPSLTHFHCREIEDLLRSPLRNPAAFCNYPIRLIRSSYYLEIAAIKATVTTNCWPESPENQPQSHLIWCVSKLLQNFVADKLETRCGDHRNHAIEPLKHARYGTPVNILHVSSKNVMGAFQTCCGYLENRCGYHPLKTLCGAPKPFPLFYQKWGAKNYINTLEGRKINIFRPHPQDSAGAFQSRCRHLQDPKGGGGKSKFLLAHWRLFVTPKQLTHTHIFY